MVWPHWQAHLDRRKIFHAAAVLCGSGVDGRGGFQKDHLACLGQGDRAMFDPVRHDDEFALLNDFLTVAKTHQKPPTMHQEQLVLRLVESAR